MVLNVGLSSGLIVVISVGELLVSVVVLLGVCSPDLFPGPAGETVGPRHLLNFKDAVLTELPPSQLHMWKLLLDEKLLRIFGSSVDRQPPSPSNVIQLCENTITVELQEFTSPQFNSHADSFSLPSMA